MRGPGRTQAALVLCTGLVLGGCAGGAGGEPQATPTIGSPSPSPTPSQATAGVDRPAELAREWDLTGVPLPADWPDVPLPAGAEVVTAYAIGSLPRRTWTATFTTNGGTALDMAEPVVAELRAREYVPIAEYVGAAQTNTGLYSFASPTSAVYVVLGEDDGQPNLVLTVRGSTGAESGLAELEGRRPTTGTVPPSPQVAPLPVDPSASPSESPAASGQEEPGAQPAQP
jgi:hypothetical protein